MLTSARWSSCHISKELVSGYTFMNFSCHCKLTDTFIDVKPQHNMDRDCFAAVGAGKHICAAGGTDGERTFPRVLGQMARVAIGAHGLGGSVAAMVHKYSASLKSSGMKAFGMMEVLT